MSRLALGRVRLPRGVDAPAYCRAVPATDTTDATGTAEQSGATLLERVTAAGISEARAREHITWGVVHLQGEVVADPDTPAPWPAAWFVGSDR